MIYFDNAATTFPKPDCVYEAINVAMKKYAFNAVRGGQCGGGCPHPQRRGPVALCNHQHDGALRCQPE